MSNPGTGGRGKLAPYTTVHYRIPKPIKETVERLAGAYRTLLVDRSWDSCDELLRQVNSAIADAVDFDKQQVVEQNEELENLQKQLNLANEQIRQLQLEKEKVASILVPAFKSAKPNSAGKLLKIIKELFPEVAE